MESLKLKVVAVLKPLEIKRHTVPHLKALTGCVGHTSGNGRGSTFKQHCPLRKSTSLLQKWPKRQFHVTLALNFFTGVSTL